MALQVHGALVEVLGVGVLLLGPSGVGTSECALELVQRGHRLVADDVVRVSKSKEGGEAGARLRGSAPELIRHYMEIRGLGLLYIPDLFGDASVLDEGPIDLMCRLEVWKKGAEYERVGLERFTEDLAGVSLPRLVLPVRPAASMATLIEVAARDHERREKGGNAARQLVHRIRGVAEQPLDERDDLEKGNDPAKRGDGGGSGESS